jgi:hypothetical protein
MIVKTVRTVDEYTVIPDSFKISFETVGAVTKLVYEEKCDLPEHAISYWVSPDTKMEYFYDENTKVMYIRLEGRKDAILARLLQEILSIAKSSLDEKTLVYIWQKTRTVLDTV